MVWFVLITAVIALAVSFHLNKLHIDHLPPTFVVIDLETTGPDPERHEIIEIGAIRVNRDGSERVDFNMLIKPDKSIPSRVTELTGITQTALLSTGKPMPVAIKEFRAFIGDLPLVSFNADYDLAFLKIAGQNNATTISNKISCASKMAQRAWPERKNYHLSVLSKRTNKSKVDDKYRVLDDCQSALTVYLNAASRLRTAA